MDLDMDNMLILSTGPTEVDNGDEIPLIRRQQLIVAGASNVMVQWVSDVTKYLLSGLVTSAILIVLLIIYLVVVKAEDVDPPQKYIFFIDMSERVTAQRLCAAESVARLHNDIPSYFYLTSDPIPALTLLTDSYPNFYVRKWNWLVNMRETPMEPWMNQLEHLREHLYTSPKDALELTARAMTLWKYGGTSISLDGMLKEESEWLKDIRNNDYNIVDESFGALINFEPCHVLMEKLIMKIMSLVESGKKINSTELFSEQLEQFCPFNKNGKNGRKSCPGIRIVRLSSMFTMKQPYNITSEYCPKVKSFLNFKIGSLKLNKKTRHLDQ